MQQDEDLYVVESIIGKKVVDGKLYYKVKWQGYPESDSTWEKLSHLRYVSAMVRDYEKTLSTDSSEALIANNPSAKDSLDGSRKEAADQQQQQQDNRDSNEVLSEECTEPPEPDQAREVGDEKPKGDEEAKRDEKAKEDSPDLCNQIILTRSAVKVKKEKRSLRKCEGRKLKKEVKRLKKIRKEETQDSPIPSAAKEERVAAGGEKAISAKDEQGEFTAAEMKIRLIVAEDDSDIRDYVVEYPNGNAKVFNTCQMFYAHPVEFVQYLEKRTLAKANK